MHDPDGDIVRCRWADSVRSECGGVCNALPNCILNPDTVGVQCLCMFLCMCVCALMAVCVVCACVIVRVCVCVCVCVGVGVCLCVVHISPSRTN